MKNTFDHVTKIATAVSPKWTNREIVWFHAFNDNGLVAEKHRLDDMISELVDEGKANSGAIIAYGTFDNFNVNRLRSFIGLKRVNSVKLAVAIDGLKRRNDRASDVIREKMLGK